MGLKKAEVDSLLVKVREALSYKGELNPRWSVEGARELYEFIPKLRASCARVEEILLDISSARARLAAEKREVEYVAESKEAEYIVDHTERLTSKSLSWEERKAYRHTAALDERIAIKAIIKEIEALDVFKDAIERRYRLLLGARSDAQAMANLLRIGSILSEVE